MTPSQAQKNLAALAKDARLAFIARVQQAVPEAEWFVVGGAVRDVLLGRPVKDLDLVVRRASLEKLTAALDALGSVSLVGRDFGVLKFRANAMPYDEIDIAWPRTERAGMSGGYRDFTVQADADLPIERDLSRRDFTVNAMAYRLEDGTLADPFGGLDDLSAKQIRAVGEPDARFAEDYSRMLRAIRFACQLGFEVDAATWAAVSRHISGLDDMRTVKGREERVVPRETVAKELVRALMADPVRAADLLEKCGALYQLVPELSSLAGCAQPPEHHAEGDVWTHTKMALAALHGEAFAELFPGETADATTVVAVLLHDVAKPQTTGFHEGKITFYGHDVTGADVARAIAERLRLDSAGVSPERVSWLVRHHLLPNMVQLDSVRRVTLERFFLADPVAGRQLLHVGCADGAGRRKADGSSGVTPLRALLVALAELRQGQPAAPKPLLTGDEVMAAMGLHPGPEVGALLEELREAQLRGDVLDHDGAKQFLLTKKGP